MKSLFIFGLLGVFLFALSFKAFANNPTDVNQMMNMSLEDLMQTKVSTISKVDEKLDMAPGSIYVYTRQQIQERGYHSLGELLQIVPGFTVFHKDLDYVAGVRGLNANDNEKITLLVNGQNVNNVNEPDFLSGPINLDNVERVEVVVGPSSLFQQANTLAATINVITKNINGVEIVQGIGNYVNDSSTIMAGKVWDPDKYANLSFTTEKIRGFNAWDTTPSGADSGTYKAGELLEPSFFSVIKGKYDEWSGQMVAYRSTFPEVNIDRTDMVDNPKYIDQWYTADIKNEHPINADLTNVLDMTASYLNSRRSITENIVPAYDQVQQGLTQGKYTADESLRYTGIEHNLIQAGVQGSYDDNMKDWYIYDTTTSPAPLFSRNTDAVGVYANDNIQLTDKLQFTGGARVDRNNVIPGDKYYPAGQAALAYQVTNDWVSKVIYDRVVRYPSSLAAENMAWGAGTNFDPPYFTASNTAHLPEILQTEEWQNIYYLGKVRLSLTYYHEELRDYITWFYPVSNGGNFQGNGVESDFQAPLTSHLNLWGNYTWNDSKLSLFQLPSGLSNSVYLASDVNQSGQIIGSAQNTANLGLDYKILEHLNFSPSIRYFSNQAADNNGSYITIGNRFYLDATLTWRQAFNMKNLDMHLTGENLANNREPVATQFQNMTYHPEGTSFLVSADLKF